MSTWSAKNAIQPYTRTHDLWTRAHLLYRKVGRQGGLATVHDKRIARLLERRFARLPLSNYQSEALERLSGIADG